MIKRNNASVNCDNGGVFLFENAVVCGDSWVVTHVMGDCKVVTPPKPSPDQGRASKPKQQLLRMFLPLVTAGTALVLRRCKDMLC